MNLEKINKIDLIDMYRAHTGIDPDEDVRRLLECIVILIRKIIDEKIDGKILIHADNC